MNLRDKLASHAIVAVDVRPGVAEVPEWAQDTDPWTVTLINWPAGAVMTVPFFTGHGLRASMPDGPDAADVLSVLLSGATSVINAGSYDEWLAEFGMADKPAHRETYDEILRQTQELRHFLGELTEFYLWEVDHDA